MSFKKMLKKSVKKKKSLDIDSDEIVAEAGRVQVKLFPRATYECEIRLLHFGEFETEKSVGWEALVQVQSVEVGRQEPAFDRPPKEGEIYRMIFRKVASLPFVAKEELKLLRILLCAIGGLDPSVDAKVAPIRAQLIEMSDNEELTDLDPILFTREAWLKEKDEKIYVNTRDSFESLD